MKFEMVCRLIDNRTAEKRTIPFLLHYINHWIYPFKCKASFKQNENNNGKSIFIVEPIEHINYMDWAGICARLQEDIICSDTLEINYAVEQFIVTL